ncbi:hypothetical protein ZWY2020_023002 [Hordeum vulgare]|nr:hypothetical protein ZWY2020_023002 [Hordeum vulgare]
MPADRGGDGGDASGGVRVSSIGLPRSLQDRGPGHYPHSPFLRRGFLPRVDADEYAYAIARRRKNGMLAVAAAGEEDLVGVSRWQCSTMNEEEVPQPNQPVTDSVYTHNR